MAVNFQVNCAPQVSTWYMLSIGCGDSGDKLRDIQGTTVDNSRFQAVNDGGDSMYTRCAKSASYATSLTVQWPALTPVYLGFLIRIAW